VGHAPAAWVYDPILVVPGRRRACPAWSMIREGSHPRVPAGRGKLSQSRWRDLEVDQARVFNELGEPFPRAQSPSSAFVLGRRLTHDHAEAGPEAGEEEVRLVVVPDAGQEPPPGRSTRVTLGQRFARPQVRSSARAR
jgi:hypothetical protein